MASSAASSSSDPEVNEAEWQKLSKLIDVHRNLLNQIISKSKELEEEKEQQIRDKENPVFGMAVLNDEIYDMILQEQRELQNERMTATVQILNWVKSFMEKHDVMGNAMQKQLRKRQLDVYLLAVPVTDDDKKADYCSKFKKDDKDWHLKCSIGPKAFFEQQLKENNIVDEKTNEQNLDKAGFLQRKLPELPKDDRACYSFVAHLPYVSEVRYTDDDQMFEDIAHKIASSSKKLIMTGHARIRIDIHPYDRVCVRMYRLTNDEVIDLLDTDESVGTEVTESVFMITDFYWHKTTHTKRLIKSIDRSIFQSMISETKQASTG